MAKAPPERSAPGRRSPWTVRGRETRYENPWLRLVHYDVLKPNGEPGIYGVCRFNTLAVAVLPVFHDGDVMLVGQWRFGIDEWSWELPEGGGPLDQDPLAHAKTELVEETGLAAAHWREILRMASSNSVTDERVFGYLAWDLSQGEASPEDSEAITLRRLPFAELHHMVLHGEITDAPTMAMTLKARALAQARALPAPLSDLLG